MLLSGRGRGVRRSVCPCRLSNYFVNEIHDFQSWLDGVSGESEVTGSRGASDCTLLANGVRDVTRSLFTLLFLSCCLTPTRTH